MIGFAVLGIVGLPLYRLFFVGTICFGVGRRWLLYLIGNKEKPTGFFA